MSTEPSPGKAWNLLTVGAFNDNNTSTWSDDTMSQFSAYYDPDSINMDREKPEVVAVGQNVTLLGENNVSHLNIQGTSLAAPLVSGLTALLVHRYQTLAAWPEATRAIIMAAALHNIENWEYDYLGDRRDGVGGINSALATSTAQVRGTTSSTAADPTPCTRPCWWATGTNVYPGYQVFTKAAFTVTRGERVRVVTSWWSNADCSNPGGGCNYGYDNLDTDMKAMRK